MRTLGVDPGTAATGFAVLEGEGRGLKLLEFGCIKTSPKNESHERLNIISEKMQKILDKFKPDVMAVEQLFFTSNAKTAIRVGEARGVILLSAARNGVRLAEYTPLQVKQALTGYGRADKKQIQYMVKNLLGLKEIPKPDDAADAIAIAICHLNSYKLKGLR